MSREQEVNHLYFQYGDKETEYLKKRDKALGGVIEKSVLLSVKRTEQINGYRPCKRCKPENI